MRYKGFKSYNVSFIDEGMRKTNSRLLTLLISNLVPDTRYQFQVATKAGCNDLKYSNIVEAVTRIDGKMRYAHQFTHLTESFKCSSTNFANYSWEQLNTCCE